MEVRSVCRKEKLFRLPPIDEVDARKYSIGLAVGALFILLFSFFALGYELDSSSGTWEITGSDEYLCTYNTSGTSYIQWDGCEDLDCTGGWTCTGLEVFGGCLFGEWVCNGWSCTSCPVGQHSGYEFEGKNDTTIQPNVNFSVGTFTHHNFPIISGPTEVELTVDLTIETGSGTANIDDLKFTFFHNETPNSGSDPRDIVTFPTNYTTETFTVGGIEYQLKIIGFESEGQGLVSQWYTNENATNEAELIVKLVPPTGTITVHKFHDENGDGVQGANESDLEGWNMSLYQGFGCSGTLEDSGSTNLDGNVQFFSLEAGDYSVEEQLQGGWQELGTCKDVSLAPGGSATVNFANRKYHLDVADNLSSITITQNYLENHLGESRIAIGNFVVSILGQGDNYSNYIVKAYYSHENSLSCINYNGTSNSIIWIENPSGAGNGEYLSRDSSSLITLQDVIGSGQETYPTYLDLGKVAEYGGPVGDCNIDVNIIFATTEFFETV